MWSRLVTQNTVPRELCRLHLFVLLSVEMPKYLKRIYVIFSEDEESKLRKRSCVDENLMPETKAADSYEYFIQITAEP